MWLGIVLVTIFGGAVFAMVTSRRSVQVDFSRVRRLAARPDRSRERGSRLPSVLTAEFRDDTMMGEHGGLVPYANERATEPGPEHRSAQELQTVGTLCPPKAPGNPYALDAEIVPCVDQTDPEITPWSRGTRVAFAEPAQVIARRKERDRQQKYAPDLRRTALGCNVEARHIPLGRYRSARTAAGPSAAADEHLFAVLTQRPLSQDPGSEVLTSGDSV